MSGSFNAEKQAFRSAVIAIVTKSDLDLINEDTFTLDTLKFNAIKEKISQKQTQDEIITSYKTAAIEQTFPSTNVDTVAKYILKKRAALVYMCMLYIQKLNESKNQETTKLKTILDQLQLLKNTVGQTEPNVKNTDIDKATALISAITTDVTTLIQEKKKKDALFDDIIPFVATRAEVSDDFLNKA